MAFFEKLLYGVLVAAVPTLVAFLCALITEKFKELKAKKQMSAWQNSIDAVNTVIVNAVMATTQTYVDALKQDKLFNVEAQKQAFEKTKEAVLAQLTQDGVTAITNVYGDVNAYLTSKIEATVKENK